MKSEELSRQESIEFLQRLLEQGDFKRLGKTFKTRQKYYFYDRGTGKVLECGKGLYDLLCCLERNNNVDDYDKIDKNFVEEVHELKEAFETEKVLQAPEVKQFGGTNINYLEESINEHLEQMTLELTERCNLRCKYCIYGSENLDNRDFGNNDMSFEIAKKAIDYAAAHSGKSISIVFYGGEPLLKFDLLKECVEYCEDRLQDKELTFNMTSNMVLMDEEKANYFAKKKNFMITCSLDGPELIHDENRVFPDGKGSFQKTYQGLKNFVTAIEDKETVSERVSISMVVTPPYTTAKLEDMKEFYESIKEWLPLKVVKNVAYVDYGNHDVVSEEVYSGDNKDRDPIGNWSQEYLQTQGGLDDEKLFTSDGLIKGLYRIHARRLCEEPIESFTFNGCCTPANRRLYVTVDGKFKVCEKIGFSPYIGDIDKGIDLDAIKKYYIDDYMKNSIPECQKCWAVHLCSICYECCYTKEGINMVHKNEACKLERATWAQKLADYHEILETSPEKLEFLNTIHID